MITSAGKRIVVAALAGGALLAAPTAEAKPAIEIVSPKRGTVLVAGKPNQALTVRVRVAGNVRGLRAVANTGRRDRVVTGRFRDRRGGVKVATLRLGRELRPGAGAIRLRGKVGRRLVAASSHFWVVSRKRELIAVSGLPRRTAPRALDVRMRTAKRVDDVRVRINGRNARDVFTRTLGGRWRGELSASHGLHFGRNRVTITAYDRRGAFERVHRVVRVQRGRPLAGAGRDVLTRQRKTIILDGRTTLPRRDERLRFEWRIVRRPKGSKARLRNPHAVRPRLRADRPGTYRVRLTVRPRRHGARSSAVQSTDTVTVSAQPAVSPQGIPLQTIAVDGQSGNGVMVGSSWLPGPAEGFQLVVLDGSTAEVQQNLSSPPTDGGAQYVADIVEEVSDNSIVILTMASGQIISQQGANDLGAAFQGLGIDPETTDSRFDGFAPATGWTVVGSPGGHGGHALIGVQQDTSHPAGAMHGFLQNSAGATAGAAGDTYVFNWPSDFIQFDTHSGGDGVTNNVMTIAGQTYQSDTVGDSGFHLVWLDGGTLGNAQQRTISGGDTGQQLAQQLTNIANAGPAMLFLTTIGNPKAAFAADGSNGDGWATAADQIAAFGGNASAFLSLDGTPNAQYSLAGASASGALTPNAGTDVSRILRPGVPAARVVGLLERRPGGAYDVGTGGAPTAAADVSALMPDIRRVLAQPAEPFAPFAGPAQAAAEQYIAAELGISASDPTYGIRANYWDPGLAAQWANLQSDIDDPNIVPPCPTAPCSEGFDAVRDQLDREFSQVAKVRTYFGSYADGTLYGAFNNEFTSGTWSFDEVSEYITSKYPPQEAQASGPNPFDVIEGMLDLSAELVPEGGEALGVAGAAIEIANAFIDTNSASSSYAGATVFEAQAAQFASTLEQGYTDNLNGLDRIADLLVSDAGRLQAAGQAVLGDWAVDSTDIDATLDRSIGAYMWLSLLPTTFDAYHCVMPPVYFPPEDFRPAPWYQNDIETPGNLQFKPFATQTNWPQRQSGGWGPADNASEQVNNIGFLTMAGQIAGNFGYIDSGVAADLFGPIDSSDPTKLGLLPQYLLAPQPYDSAAGFAVNQGSYDDGNSDQTGYVRYFCAQNEWREDTNVRGQ